VDDQGSASVADFGLISFLERNSQSTEGRGNAQWMAPEMYTDSVFKRTPATDIYSFGCLCLEVRQVWVSGPRFLTFYCY
jgi:serine/threonine protein kinase